MITKDVCLCFTFGVYKIQCYPVPGPVFSPGVFICHLAHEDGHLEQVSFYGLHEKLRDQIQDRARVLYEEREGARG